MTPIPPLSYSSAFTGFPSGKVRMTRIPEQFFKDLVPKIDSLPELKVTLFTLWLVDQMEGEFRFLRQRDFMQETVYFSGMGLEPKEAIEDGLQRAIQRGTILQVKVPAEADVETYFFLNTPRGRAAVDAIEKGNWQPGNLPQQPITIGQARPNIFRLYEENIGPLTPLIGETLTEAEQTYHPEWIEDAFRIAIENNVRRWRYIQAILESWQKEGRNEQTRGDTEKDRRRYIEGPFAEFINH